MIQFHAANPAKHSLMAAAFVLGVTLVGMGQTKPDAKALVQSGRQQMQEARKAGTEEAYQKAEAAFTEALQLEPGNAEALTYRGLVRLERAGLIARQGNFEASGKLTNEAVADLDLAVSLNPSDYQARLMRGLSYAQFPSFLNKGATAIEDLEGVTKHSQFANQSPEARARVYLVLGNTYAAAGQTEKAKESFRAAATSSAQTPSGTAAQKELDKLGTAPVATDSLGRRRPDQFPQINPDTSPVIVAATFSLPASENSQGKVPPSLRDFMKQLEKQPGLLGVHTLTSLDHPQMLVILTWWQDKKALNDWFYSDVHQGIIKKYYVAGEQQASADKNGQRMSRASQIGMELFTSLPGSIRYGGGLTPDNVVKKSPRK